jgi:hypothetical protein
MRNRQPSSFGEISPPSPPSIVGNIQVDKRGVKGGGRGSPPAAGCPMSHLTPLAGTSARTSGSAAAT